VFKGKAFRLKGGAFYRSPSACCLPEAVAYEPIEPIGVFFLMP
jgi:hypothetical protein